MLETCVSTALLIRRRSSETHSHRPAPGIAHSGTRSKGLTVDKPPTDSGSDSSDIETAADRREQAADARERDLDAREYQVLAREDADSERANRVQEILTAADKRDGQADARDGVSNKRDMAANLDAWLNDTDDEEAQEARRLAADDRTHSRRDRTASSDARDHLAEGGTRPSTDADG